LTFHRDDQPVLISPFANERVREWPADRYRELVDVILRSESHPVAIIGTRQQRVRANAIVRGFASEKVINACGSLAWDELLIQVDRAPYVVANNSGIAHLAASRGTWTLCIFAASHAMHEWMPRGPKVVSICRTLSCSPCSVGASDYCPNEFACMADLEAADIFWRFHSIRRSHKARLMPARQGEVMT